MNAHLATLLFIRESLTGRLAPAGIDAGAWRDWWNRDKLWQLEHYAFQLSDAERAEVVSAIAAEKLLKLTETERIDLGYVLATLDDLPPYVPGENPEPKPTTPAVAYVAPEDTKHEALEDGALAGVDAKKVLSRGATTKVAPATSGMTSLSKPFKEGYSGAPKEFLRSAAFTFAEADTSEGVNGAVFDVLGMTDATVIRTGKPLTTFHLQAMLFLLSRVSQFDTENGVTIHFNPWHVVKALGMATNERSLKKLSEAFDDLSSTKIGLKDWSKRAPLLGEIDAVVAESSRKDWSCQVLALVLREMQKNLTFVSLDTLAKLPTSGPAQWLACFVSSQTKNQVTTWDVDELVEKSGITAVSKASQRFKLSAALDLLKEGKAKKQGGVEHSFNPLLADYLIFKTTKGKWRCKLVRSGEL